MKPALMLLLLCTGCATREVVRIQKVPVRERQERIIVIPVEVPPTPPSLKPKESERWA